MIIEEQPNLSNGWKYSQLKWGLQMYKTGRKNTNLKDKCGGCKHYESLTKRDKRMGFEVEYCRGNCSLRDSYKQRTDNKCMKYVEVKNGE